jgi:hypothetical protein
MSELRKILDGFDGGRRWLKGHFRDSAGNRCILGALGVLGSREFNTIQPVIEGVIAEQYPDRCIRVGPAYDIQLIPSAAHFNDHPDTTWNDVERVFEKADLLLDEQI